MTVLRFKRFTRPQTLQRIGRPLLLRFFETFRKEFASNPLWLPQAELTDPEWFCSLARLLSGPEGLPDSVCEALYAVDGMASPDGQDQLERALAKAGLPLAPEADWTREELALQAWLAAPALVTRLHNQQRLRRLTSFHYFGTLLLPAQRPPFRTPDASTLEALARALDPWFARHHRGRNTTRVELYVLPDRMSAAGCPTEFWFLIRHGDTLTRAPKVEEQRTEMIHFRPQRDDVVVYSRDRDEIRINSRTRGERDLYVRAFGLCLRGSEAYFSARDTYTLEPLRTEGPDALQSDDIPGLAKITLRELQIALEGKQNQVLTRAAADLFQCSAVLHEGPIPSQGRLCQAAFDLHFTGCPAPRPLHICPPNTLKLGRHCDLHLVDCWLSRRGFRTNREGSN